MSSTTGETGVKFSYWNPKKSTFKAVPSKQLQELKQYLKAEFNSNKFEERIPFLFVWVSGDIPLIDNRPSTIADLLPIWLKEGQATPDDATIGDIAGGEIVEIDAGVLQEEKLSPHIMPSFELLARLKAARFPKSLALSFIADSLVIELPEQDADSYVNTLASLPPGLMTPQSAIPIRYHNGPYAATEMKRRKRPNSRFNDDDDDDTDYVETIGGICPGVCLKGSSLQFSAGIFVEKENDVRLTVACHAWNEFNMHLKKGGHVPAVQLIHAGKNIGNVNIRMGLSDVGLAALNDGLKATNKFLDIPTIAKKLLPSQDFEMYDQFLIDSFVTSKQRLSSLGRRVCTQYSEDFQGGQPDPGLYVVLKQNIYSTEDPEIPGYPRIRAGMCGSAVVHCHTFGSNWDNKLGDGEVVGFMHWSDVQLLDGRSKVPRPLICLADAVDDLIEDGWEVAALPGMLGGRIQDALPVQSTQKPKVSGSVGEQVQQHQNSQPHKQADRKRGGGDREMRQNPKKRILD